MQIGLAGDVKEHHQLRVALLAVNLNDLNLNQLAFESIQLLFDRLLTRLLTVFKMDNVYAVMQVDDFLRQKISFMFI